MTLAEMIKHELPHRFWNKRWHLVSGCTECSPGCTNCWLRVEANMRQHNPHESVRRLHAGLLAENSKRWNGTVRCNEHLLEMPLRRRKPTVWAIWSDLFHESVDDRFRSKAFAVMSMAHQHRFVIVTKRPEIALEYLKGREDFSESANAVLRCNMHHRGEIEAPKANVTILVTMEDQLRADDRAPRALEIAGMGWTVGALCEPLLGPVRLDRIHETGTTIEGAHWEGWESALNGKRFDIWGEGADANGYPRLSWVITGGESGPRARPAHLDWFKSLKDQAQTAGVPFLLKSWGAWFPIDPARGLVETRKASPGKSIALPWMDGQAWLQVPK